MYIYLAGTTPAIATYQFSDSQITWQKMVDREIESIAGGDIVYFASAVESDTSPALTS